MRWMYHLPATETQQFSLFLSSLILIPYLFETYCYFKQAFPPYCSPTDTLESHIQFAIEFLFFVFPQSINYVMFPSVPSHVLFGLACYILLH